ncbi:OmpH family outer membrane protein [Candidatus Phycosocius spiralis]|uniref:OmpH family outer membrane protein n=1 Tax=Candidatus Phycosocius spiralis TaxID=2815099 RepID=A0ABQ4PT00_9PROT|nr:OmpH family outer membrane protein [Candidatus Phycosocius spiralis]GIU66118.1 hypothetical protein PsB1_0272 [Candidatus Phycosocius spiralis]
MTNKAILAGLMAALLAGAAQAQAPIPVPAPAPTSSPPTTPAAAPPNAARPTSAPAVLSPVVIYDLGRLIQDSTAGQDMRTKLQAIRDQINRELEPDQRQLQSELNAIRATSVADAQTPAAQARQEAFQRLYAQFQQKQERLGQVMQLTERNALEAFSNAFSPAMQQAMVTRNALVAMQAQQVEAFVPGVDMTGDLITRLNATTKTINVVRATLPTPPAAGTAPAAAAPRPVPPTTPAPGAPLPRQPASVPPRS